MADVILSDSESTIMGPLEETGFVDSASTIIGADASSDAVTQLVALCAIGSMAASSPFTLRAVFDGAGEPTSCGGCS